MSSYTISKTNTKSISACVQSTETNTTATQTSGRDVTHTDVQNSGDTKTTYNHDVSTKTTGKVEDSTEYKYDAHETLSWTLSEVAQIKANALDSSVTITNSNTVGMQWLTDEVTNTTTYSDSIDAQKWPDNHPPYIITIDSFKL